MNNRKFNIFLGLLFVAGCAPIHKSFGTAAELNWKGKAASFQADPDLQSKALDVLSQNCGDCHDGSKARGGVGHITNVDYLIGRKLIVPGNPQAGPIMKDILDGSMPKDDKMSDADIKAVQSWISDLTPKDQKKKKKDQTDSQTDSTDTINT